ncbi:hypothetical protein BGZ63DRAFT_421025 [Mariannaea sp. PMI_226]|nr:hypothetical protein BGZ63DRAFT_421025 [Mariannaea sp. PMI_226]
MNGGQPPETNKLPGGPTNGHNSNSNSNSSLAAKKRKKDSLKPIITTDGTGLHPVGLSSLGWKSSHWNRASKTFELLVATKVLAMQRKDALFVVVGQPKSSVCDGMARVKMKKNIGNWWEATQAHQHLQCYQANLIIAFALSWSQRATQLGLKPNLRPP